MDYNTTIQLQQAVSLARAIEALGEKLPSPFATALAAHAAAAEVTDVPAIDLNIECLTVTAKDVPALINRAVDEGVRRAALAPVRGDVLDRLARRVINTARDAGPVYIAAAAPRFTEAAADFTLAVPKLPPRYQEPAELIARGSAAVRSYEEAMAAKVTLDDLRAHRDFLARIGLKAPGHAHFEIGTRYTEVTTADAALLAARVYEWPSGTGVGELGPLGVWPALLDVDGVEGLVWRTIEEQAQAIAALPEPPAQPRKRPAWAVA